MSRINLELCRENCWKLYLDGGYKGQLLRTRIKDAGWLPTFEWEAFSGDGLPAKVFRSKLEAVRHLVQYGRANEGWLRRAA